MAARLIFAFTAERTNRAKENASRNDASIGPGGGEWPVSCLASLRGEGHHHRGRGLMMGREAFYERRVQVSNIYLDRSLYAFRLCLTSVNCATSSRSPRS